MSDPLRFFVPASSLQGHQVVIEGDPFHHLHHVLRTRPGTVVTLLDGRGLCCAARIETMTKSEASATVLHRWTEQDRTVPITLIQAMPKGDKFDLVLQKGTELGVTCFQPIETGHAIPRRDPSRLARREQRWLRIATEAARQCRRSILPQIRPVQKLSEALAEQSDHLKLVLWEAGSVPLSSALPAGPPPGVRLLVGPEGGFSTEEIDTITVAGYRAVHLGPRILRTETAGLAVAPILQYLYGDWHLAPSDNNPNQHKE